MYKKEEFLKKALLTHDDLDNYDWEKTDFNYRDEIGNMHIFCKNHGYFSIRPNHFLNGVGCQSCNNRHKDDEEVKKELMLLHPNLDFSQTKYSERDEKYRIKVICPKHGEMYLNYYNLLNGEGCKECSLIENGKKHRLTNEEIIRRGEEMYGKGTYTYEKLDTQNRIDGDKIIVTCPEHGDFITSIFNFINGRSSCQKCHQSKLETRVEKFLKEKNIAFIKQKTFEWLRFKKELYIDFYLPEYNTAIECQGIQHFKPVDVYGGIETYNERVKRDALKKTLCEEHNVKILYYMEYRYKKYNNDYSSLNEMLTEIQKREIITS